MSDEQQSILTKIAPPQTSEIEEKLNTKNALSVVLNRVRDMEEKAEALYQEAQFLRKQLEVFFDEY